MTKVVVRSYPARKRHHNVPVLISSKPLDDLNKPVLLNWRTVSSNKVITRTYTTVCSVKSLNSTGLSNLFCLYINFVDNYVTLIRKKF